MKAGDAVVTIQNTTVMTVTIQVDDRNIGFIKLGDMISLSDYNGNSYLMSMSMAPPQPTMMSPPMPLSWSVM